jgi:Subtilase family
MHDEKLFSTAGDPLRYIDARFEPVDPLFDADEPVVPFFRRRKTRSSAAVAAAIAACVACGDGSVTPAPGAILVQLERGAAPPATIARDDVGPPIVPLPALAPAEDAPLLRVPIEAGKDPAAAAAEAAASAGVSFAEPIYVYQTRRLPNDPRYGELWGLDKIGAPSAWARSTGERSVVVAVVDDGVAMEHPDLASNIWRNPSELEGNRRDDDLDGYVDDIHGWDFVDDDNDPSPAKSGEERWHGSHVAGTIGAAGDNRLGVVGVNWKVSLMPLRAIGPRGGRTDHLAKAIDFAAEHGARVINASWGGAGNSQVIANAVARAHRKGVLFVAAAGNDSAASPSFPANLKIENVISVGATTREDRLAAFSDRAAMVAAPGVDILSTTAPGRYESYEGTSMAAPHVAGLAALLWATHPNATLAQVRKGLLDSALAVRGVEHGRVDAMRALAALDHDAMPGAASLRLSRDALTFNVRPGRMPRAQTITLHTDGGGSTPFTVAADQPWIVPGKTKAETPARISIRVDPAGLRSEKGEGHVTFTAEGQSAATLKVIAQAGAAPPVAVQGEGCDLREGKLHARAGAGCALTSTDGETADVSWVLPDGAQLSGGRMYGQFVRRGEFQLVLGSSDGDSDSLPVVIE